MVKGVTVRALGPGDEAAWDRFVENCPEAGFFHLSGWKSVVEQTLGHPCPFLWAERDGAVTGVLPLGHVTSFLFGNALISAPFAVYGGPAASDDDSRAALVAKAREMAESLGVGALEMRNRTALAGSWAEKDLYVTFEKAINPDPEANLLAIPRKQRAVVRKGIKAGLVGTLDDDLDLFYRLFSESYRNLGTPVLPKRFFQRVKETFGDRCRAFNVRRGEEAVCTVLTYYFKGSVMPYYAGGTPAARSVGGHDFMYWDLLRLGAEAGFTHFDFGRSKKGTGSFNFKKYWGFAPVDLPYQYHLVKDDAMPEVNPMNPKYRLFIETWKRLPLGLSQKLGPWIARGLG